MKGSISHSFNDGRYGNELFQLISTIGIAKENDMHASFPYIRQQLIKYHPFAGQYVGNFTETHTHTEANRYNYYKINPSDGCRLIGHFQSPLYWNNDWSLAQSILYDNEFIGINTFNKYFRNGARSGMTLLHVRRTDYVNHGWFVGKEYFQKMIDANKDDYFFICSDDVQWVKDNLKIKNYMICPDASPEETLHLAIACCKKFIISNSTFSWWMAYLSSYAPEVYYPDFFVGNFPNRDLYPKTWNKVQF